MTRKDRLRKDKQKAKWEFSKKLALWAIMVATLSLIASYLLSLFDKDSVTDVTTAVFNGSIAYLVSYAAKSATEKISRNRHNLDENGNPREVIDDGTEDQLETEIN